MNIQNADLSRVSFNAKIGPYLEDEINRKKKYIQESGKFLVRKSLNDIEDAVAAINSLFPSVNGSPVTVDIEVSDKKHVKNRKYEKKRKFVYVIKNESDTFYFCADRESDNSFIHFDYKKLISTLKELSVRLKPWI